jgi:hypothetical protein
MDLRYIYNVTASLGIYFRLCRIRILGLKGTGQIKAARAEGGTIAKIVVWLIRRYMLYKCKF